MTFSTTVIIKRQMLHDNSDHTDHSSIGSMTATAAEQLER